MKTFASLTALALFSACAQAATLDLRLIETSDIHMNLLDYDYYQDQPVKDYGMPLVATLIKQARAEAPNNLLLDNGDLLQGTPMGDVVALHPGPVHPAIQVLNALHYDAANIGNHDFNYGLPLLRQAIAAAHFPYLDANVVLAGSHRPAFTPSVILTRQFVDSTGHKRRLRIGLIGLTPPQIMQWDRANLAGKVDALDMVETAKRLVPQLHAAGADVVVVIAHTGLEPDAKLPRLSENTATELARIPGIDVLLLGHQHELFPGPNYAGYPGVDLARATIHGVPAVMPGRWGDHLGLIDLKLDDSSGKWRVEQAQVSLRSAKGAEPDASLEALLAPEHRATLKAIRAPVTQTTAPITSYFAQVQDSAVVQLVADAQAEAVRQALTGKPDAALPLLSAAAPLKAGSSADGYTDIAAGPLTMRGVADLYVYPNTVEVVKISGAQVADWLEMSVSQFRRIDPAGPAEQMLLDDSARAYNFDCIKGVRYAVDVTQAPRFDADGHLINPQSHRIKDLQWQGKPIGPSAQFLVVTNNYRASGGGHFPGIDGSNIVLDLAKPAREVLTRYLAEHQPLTPKIDGNWHILPVPGVHLQFRSGAGGAKVLADEPQIKQVRVLDGGWALYELGSADALLAPAPGPQGTQR